MARHSVSDDDEPLEDNTAALTLRNKKTERMKRKNAARQQKRDAIVNLAKLPTELLLECLKYLRPRDVFSFSFVNRRFYGLVEANAHVIGDAIIARRYNILAQCLPTPKLLTDVDPAVQALLTDPGRQKQLSIHNRPYQHIQSPDPHQLCTCLTCILTWNNLGLVLDFSHWQDHLDIGIPIPVIPRGQSPDWNKELVARNARIARKAVENSLWHAAILALHLESTVRAIRRHSKNRGNQRIHVDMTAAEAATETDAFLAKHGPPSLEFPYQRDEYYMLYVKQFAHFVCEDKFRGFMLTKVSLVKPTCRTGGGEKQTNTGSTLYPGSTSAISSSSSVLPKGNFHICTLSNHRLLFCKTKIQ
jgi:hypothetical protein